MRKITGEEDGVMELQYQYTLYEKIEYCIRQQFVPLLKDKLYWAMLAGFGIFSYFNHLPVIRSVLLVAVFLLILLLTMKYWQTVRTWQSGEYCLQMNDGVLTFASERGSNCFLCKAVQDVKVHGHSVWISVNIGGTGAPWIILVPVRAFGGKEKLNEFMQELECQKQNRKADAERQFAAKTEGWKRNVDFYFVQTWEKERRIQAEAHMQALRKNNPLKEKKRGWRWWTGLTLALFLFTFWANDYQLLLALGLTTLIVLAYYAGSQEFVNITVVEDIRKTAEQGNWAKQRWSQNILISDQGIIFFKNASETHWKWSELGDLIETDILWGFYDKKGKNVCWLLKDMAGKESQQRRITAYCKEHGVKHQYVKPLVVRTNEERSLLLRQRKQERKPASRKILLLAILAYILFLLFYMRMNSGS